MSTLHILVSGDYWHHDFRGQLSTLEAPATMVPLERISSVADRDFQLIVLAQSRRDQISQATVDALRELVPNIPVVVMLGSWCEGENRSGNPLAGVNLVPWHQWKSGFERFCMQIVEGVTPDWCQPLTATKADHVRDYVPDPTLRDLLVGKQILISTEDRVTFETVADMLRVYECVGFWSESDEELPGSERLDAICVDGNSVSEEFELRLNDLSEKHCELPMVAMLNFPRQQDFAALSTLGVQEVVSKPYSHIDILHSLARALGVSTTVNQRSGR
jgi:hypothetical protein